MDGAGFELRKEKLLQVAQLPTLIVQAVSILMSFDSVEKVIGWLQCKNQVSEATSPEYTLTDLTSSTP